MLIGTLINVIRKSFDQALDECSNGQCILQITRHITDTYFHRTKVMMRTDIPPDFANAIDESGIDHVVDEPYILTPVAHEGRQTGSG